MIKHFHGPYEIEWTDEQWKRFQAVKNGEHIDSPARDLDATFAVCLKSEMKEKLKQYAVDQGLTLSEVVRQAIYVLTQ